MDRLTVEQAAKGAEAFFYRDGKDCALGQVYQQLADTMRENERLREALIQISNTSQSTVGNPITVMRGIAKEALSYKDSDNG